MVHGLQIRFQSTKNTFSPHHNLKPETFSLLPIDPTSSEAAPALATT
jgi:hypothetical protein